MSTYQKEDPLTKDDGKKYDVQESIFVVPSILKKVSLLGPS